MVASFIENKEYDLVRKIQKSILTAYEQDFSKHVPPVTVPRIRMLWSSIPSQLAKENRKFTYSTISKGARAREYELAMTWLLDCGFNYKVHRISKPEIPLLAFLDLSAFKLYFLDVGLLGAMSNLNVKSLLEGNLLFSQFKGSLTEQHVLQQLIASQTILLFYWSAEKGRAEVDFVFL